MTIEEFQKEKIEGRQELFEKIIQVFKQLDPVAIHQFGSGITGYKDEFSDLDLWITFSDTNIKKILDKKEAVFTSIDPVLIKSDSPQNAPMGGTYTLVIYDSPSGLYHVDYYLSPKSGNNIRTDAKLLFGDDSLPRGEWILNRTAKAAKERWTADHVLDQALAMAFILNKAIVRGGWNVTHANYIRSVYRDFGEITNQTLPSLPESANFEFIKKLYENLTPFANNQQKKALKKLKEYTDQVEKLYTIAE